MTTRPPRADHALRTLADFPAIPLGHYPTPVDEMPRLRAALGGGPTLLVKRDDAISFAFGGNKVRKLALVGAHAAAAGADTLITAGGVQSNHARVTAATAARLGMQCVIVANRTAPRVRSGQAPEHSAGPEQPTGNALLDLLLGGRIEYVAARTDRAPRMEAIAEQFRHEGRRPYVIPIGASIPLGALGLVRALVELEAQMPAPDAIVHSTSSAGTQAGLVAGCRLLGWRTRVIGVSADDPTAVVQRNVESLVRGIGDLLQAPEAAERDTPIEVDDAFVGEGYGIPTEASREALELTARTEALFLDPTYTAKAMAGLIAYVRTHRFSADQTILFWHTGGQVGLFA